MKGTPLQTIGSHAKQRMKKKPGPRSRLSESDIQAISNRYLAGDTAVEIAEDYSVGERHIRSLISKHGLKKQLAERRQSIPNLQAQINRLTARKNPTDSVCQRIAMLTRALGRLKKAAPQPKPKPVIQTTLIQEHLDAALGDDFGLYPYQKELITDTSRFRCDVKSRQIGFSFALALRCVLRCAAGQNQLVISASQEQSDIIIDYAIQHASKLSMPLDATSKHEITIGTNTIKALPANFRSIQGFNGDVTLDEFAWQTNQTRIWRSVVPSITAVGGSVHISSTPFKPGTLFWQIATNHQNKYSQFASHTTTIHDAIKQGMPLPGGLDELRSLFDTESWALMYECQWLDDGSALLSWKLIESLFDSKLKLYKSSAEPVRIGIDVGTKNDRFAVAIYKRKETSWQYTNGWDKKGMSFDAMEAAIADLFKSYNVEKMRIDRTGLGSQLSERMTTRYGATVEGIWFTQQIKEQMAINILKLAEDSCIAIPPDSYLASQLHAVKKIGKQRGISYQAERDDLGHGDVFWAHALALHKAAGMSGQFGAMVL